MKRSRIGRAAVLGLALAQITLQAAQAQSDASDGGDINPDRPGIADGSKVVGAGRLQIEAGVQRELRHPDGASDRSLFIPTLLRLGVSRDLELRVETNGHTWERVRAGSGVTTSRGFDPVSLGLKYHVQDADGPRRPSLGVIARVFAPSGSGDFRTRHTTADLRLAADWDLAPDWSLNPNVGVALYEDDGRTFAAGLFATTLSYSPSPALSLFVDTGVQSPEAKHGRTSVIFDAGIAYVIGHDLQLDASLGTGAAGATPPHPFLSAGISRRF